MAVGDISLPNTIYPIQGVKIGIHEAYIRYQNRKDLVIFELAEGSSVAGVFTQNSFCAAPVQVCKQHLQQQKGIRYLIINTGNANAGTGEVGLQNAYRTCAELAQVAGVDSEQILPFSTGVIGEQLPMERLIAGLQPCLAQADANAWQTSAHGIMTTDTIPKVASEQFQFDGITYHITGISKGAGMIRPNMATMLGFVATDLPIAQPLLQKLLNNATEQSFNRITIDGDTSTNDSCILMATGQAGGEILASEDDVRYQAFAEILNRVMKRLAELIVRDGEGATKFVAVQVEGGATIEECCDVAYSIAHSPLVKTALFASDPNWGRLVAAIGNAGLHNLDVSKINIWLDDVLICQNGGLASTYREEQGATVMAQSEFVIRVELNRGEFKDTVYTCDFSYDYVKINADYRS